MMEISNETKAKVLNQYSGQPCLSIETGKQTFNCCMLPEFSPKEEGYHVWIDHEHFGVGQDMIDGFKLILKPLDKITDEDAIECLNILMATETNSFKDWMPEVQKRWLQLLKLELTEGGQNLVIKPYFKHVLFVYQYLQSKGYDLPNYILNGKTLYEAGLAIYE